MGCLLDDGGIFKCIGVPQKCSLNPRPGTGSVAGCLSVLAYIFVRGNDICKGNFEVFSNMHSNLWRVKIALICAHLFLRKETSFYSDI